MRRFLLMMSFCASFAGYSQSGLDQFGAIDFLDSSIVEIEYSGQAEVVVIPDNTSFVRVEVHGARGGDYNPTLGTYRASGGLGARLEAVVFRPSLLSDSLLINVGGQNGYNGGGEGGYGSSDGGFSGYAGNGGGRTSIFLIADGVELPLVIAGGGGGAGRAYRSGSSFSESTLADGGDAGYEFGLNGDDGCASNNNGCGLGGEGASNIQGGAGGEANTNHSFCDNGGGVFGTNGEAFIGGDGGNGFYNTAGGGGGGGYFGGGGGASPCWGTGMGGGGGGGGSSFLHSDWELLDSGAASAFCTVWDMWPNGSCQDHGRATITFLGGFTLEGCMDELACNYNTFATQDDGGCLFGCAGCTDATAPNFNPTATVDDNSCVYPHDYCGEGTIWDEMSQTCIIDETFCSWQPDSDGDLLIGVSDLLMFLSVFGDTDLDQDGIFDSNDDCIGAYDECGVCNGSGPSIPIIESIEILYDSLYAEQIDEWWVFEVGADTMFSYVCELVEGCTDQSAENYNADANVDDGSCWACGMPLAYNDDSYETVLIGDQCWFAENLATSFYSNGEPITEAESSASWYSSSPRQAAPHWEFSEVDSLGRVYNWYAMTDSRGVCPSGWHVASKSDFQVLGDELAPDINSSLKDDVTWDGTNSSGFTAILTGYLDTPQNDWQSESYTTMLWMDEPSAEALWLLSGPNCGYCEELQFMEGVNGIDKQHGYFIRCIKDTE